MKPKTTTPKRAFTIAEASEHACVSEATIRNWLVSGLLPYEELPGCGTGVNKMRRIRRCDIDEFLDRHYHKQNHSGRIKSQEPLVLAPKE